MGFLDKAKEAAEKAKNAAQQAAHQGQDKIEEMKSERAESGLLKVLGEAVYAEQRHAGPHQAVDAALSALDAHHAEVAAATAAAQAAAAAKEAAAASAAPQSATAHVATPGATAGTPDLEEIVIEE